mmetsp:Transcript_24197/g.75283  ORF Transcript_24197/g.75283 Transcript_24197/m.75283 type:complete len:499 (+) Transcript_24197:86-1582(+)
MAMRRSVPAPKRAETALSRAAPAPMRPRQGRDRRGAGGVCLSVTRRRSRRCGSTGHPWQPAFEMQGHTRGLTAAGWPPSVAAAAPSGQAHPRPLHHLAELVEGDLAVPVQVDLLQDAVEPLNVLVLQYHLQLVPVYLPAAVGVEHAEGRPEHLPLHVLLRRERRGDELRVVDRAGAVGVEREERLLHVRGNVDLVLLHALLDLGVAQRAVLVPVQRAEGSLELIDLLLLQVLRDESQGDLLQLGRARELLQLRPKVLGELHRCAALADPEPRVLQQRPRDGALIGVEREHLGDDALGVRGDLVPVGRRELEPTRLHHLQDVAVTLPVEGRVAAKDNIGQDTAAPDVAFLVVAARVGEDLGGDVVGGAGLRLEQALSRCEGLRQAEVDHLDGCLPVLVLHQEVLRLDVSVHEALPMHVVDGAEDLLHDPCGLDLPERLPLVLLRLFYDPVEQLATGAQLHDKVKPFGVFEDFVQPHNVWMIQRLLDGDLVLEAARVGDL